jgi:hypothetical protein
MERYNCISSLTQIQMKQNINPIGYYIKVC